MKKLLLLFLVAALGGPVAMNALADDTAMKAMPDIDRVVPISQIYNDLTLIGTITMLEPETGELVLSNDVQGDVPLQFTPDEVQDLGRGDAVVVYLGFGVDQRSIRAESCELLPTRISTC